MSKETHLPESGGAERQREPRGPWEFLPDGGYPETLRFSRAREFHLYTPEGERYLDCILGGGAAVLGHNPKGLTQAVKNRLSAGPLVPAPGKEEGKLHQAVRRLFPAVRWVLPVYAEDLFPGLFAEIELWRAFENELPQGRLATGRAAGGGEPGDSRGAPAPRESWPQPPGDRFILVPSFPLAPTLLLLCGTTHWAPEAAAPLRGGSEPGDRSQSSIAASMAAAAPGPNPAGVESAGMAEAAAAAAKAAADRAAGRANRAGAPGPPSPASTGDEERARATDWGSLRSRLISPVFLAGVTKAVHLLASAYEGEALPRRLTKQERDGWRHPLSTGEVWERRGIYYRYTGAEEAYQKLRGALQECGILIPRDLRERMVCPRIITSQERSLWERVHSTL